MKTPFTPLFLLANVLFALAPVAQADELAVHTGNSIETEHPRWMGWVPDDIRVSQLSIPATHDSMALYGGVSAECQSLNLSEQLQAGIRWFDIRAQHDSDRLEIYHGVFYQNATFANALVACNQFLEANPTETIFILLGNNGVPGETDNTRDYWETVKWYRDESGWGHRIATDVYPNTNPTLGELRGKIVLASNLGWRVSSTGVTGLAHQDTFVGNGFGSAWSTCFVMPDAWEAMRSHFETINAAPDTDHTIYKNGLNGSTGVTPIDAVNGVCFMDGMNERALEYLFHRRFTNKVGIVSTDFPGAALIDIILTHNMRFAPDVDAMSDDLDYIIDNVSRSTIHGGDDRARDHLLQMKAFCEHILPGPRWTMLVSGEEGAEHWGYSIGHRGFSTVTPWDDGFRHVVMAVPETSGYVSSAQLAAYLTTAQLRTLGGTAYQRAQDLRATLEERFPGMEWNTLVKRAPGNPDNWAYSLAAHCSFTSGWLLDDGENYNYVAWASQAYDYPPVVDHGGPYQTEAGQPFTIDAGESFDPEGKSLSYRWSYDEDKNTWETGWSSDPTLTLNLGSLPQAGILLQVTEGLHEVLVEVPVTVGNAPPVPELPEEIIAVAGEKFQRKCLFRDPSDNDSWTIEVDYGDGDGSEFIPHDRKTFFLESSYATAGSYSIKLTIGDGVNKSRNDVPVTVVQQGADQILSVEAPEVAIPEGGTGMLNGVFLDPEQRNLGTVDILFDGTPASRTTVPAKDGPEYSDQYTFTGSYTYPDDPDGIGETFDAVVEIAGVGSRIVPVQVVNVAPRIVSPGVQNIEEGRRLGITLTFSDPGADTWTASIQYGDDTSQTLPTQGRTVALNHLYPDVGIYTATVTVTDDDGDSDSTSFEVMVNDVMPVGGSLTLDQASIEEGETVRATGTFTSDNAAFDEFSVVLDWGDGGAVTQASLSQLSIDSFEFTAPHLYRDDAGLAEHTITASIRDGDGSVIPITTTLVVQNAAPVVTLGPDLLVPSGTTLSMTGSFTDAGADQWTGRIDYGEGDGWQSLTLNGTSFSLSHAFQSDGLYEVVAEITDDEGDSQSAALQVLIGAPELTVRTALPGVVELSWPELPFLFRLQWSADLRAASWMDLEDPVNVGGGQNRVTRAILADREFFRLVYP